MESSRTEYRRIASLNNGIQQFGSTHQPECLLLTNPYKRSTYPVAAVSRCETASNHGKAAYYPTLQSQARLQWSLARRFFPTPISAFASGMVRSADAMCGRISKRSDGIPAGI